MIYKAPKSQKESGRIYDNLILVVNYLHVKPLKTLFNASNIDYFY